MSPHHSDQMSEMYNAHKIVFCMSISKVLWVSEWVSEWVTRSPIELFWTAKNTKKHKTHFLEKDIYMIRHLISSFQDQGRFEEAQKHPFIGNLWIFFEKSAFSESSWLWCLQKLAMQRSFYGLERLATRSFPQKTLSDFFAAGPPGIWLLCKTPCRIFWERLDLIFMGGSVSDWLIRLVPGSEISALRRLISSSFQIDFFDVWCKVSMRSGRMLMLLYKHHHHTRHIPEEIPGRFDHCGSSRKLWKS